ncbi:DeoR/GlpR family DNA-binding transcription regulator [Brachybacterium sp. FME24]|uniref:DeoR/GlpR family DNA-binding transcription regulator n=1 Tax=Brachybacterium sp. FME24 TaxID=2742605 RepID=UPI0018669153|nr:DeoR/GlpR family DNA-binding transcription regulator [Brachybacterium sp. FME24]
MGTSPLIPEQRRQQILDHLRTEPVLSYRQLTELLGVSQMTVRRDVAVLDEQGRARATQGGVTVQARLLEEPPRAAKAEANIPAKFAIAAAAAAMVTDSMTLYLDAGTTVQALRPLLQERRNLTVVTNDLGTAGAFLDHPSVDLLCVGGRVDVANQSMIGRLAALTLGELSLDIAFISSSSWDAKHGITTPVEAKIDAKRAAMASATESVLLADAGKFGHFAKYRVARLDEFRSIISNAALAAGDVTAVRELGPQVIVA